MSPKRFLPQLILLTLCTSPAWSATPPEPDWLQEARAREGEAVEVREVQGADGEFTARVPARLVGEIEFEDDVYYMELDIGAAVPVSCEVMVGGFDTANLLRAAAEISFEDLGRQHGSIEKRAVERMNVDLAAHSALFEVDWLFRADDGSGARVGALKQAAAQKDGHGVYCSHADLGYSRSFATLVRALVESLQMTPADDHGEAYYVEIGLLRLDDSRVGASIIRLVRNEEGDTRATKVNSLLLPMTDGRIAALDSYDTQWLWPDGSLMTAISVTARNGEIESNLTLGADDEGAWRVEGEYMGKEISATPQAGSDPLTVVQQARLRRAALALETPKRELSGQIWLDSDPSRFTDWTFEVTGEIDEATVTGKESAAGLEGEVVVERATGSILRATVPFGPLQLTIERALADGSF